MNEDLYDVIIIGGGPIGLTCGIEAKNAGLNYVILEKGTLVNSLFNYPVNMTFFIEENLIFSLLRVPYPISI